jgi:anti-sigma factor RsiW
MRCSLCEPALDAYLEGSLSPRDAAQVATHVRDCGSCRALLSELRIIDALLETARVPGVAADFTDSVVSATHQTPLRKPRRLPFAAALLLYVVVAWAFAAFALHSARLGAFAHGGAEFVHRGSAAVGAAVRALAPATPVVAAAVTIVLLVDLLLLAAIFYAHPRVRPLIALYLERGRRS